MLTPESEAAIADAIKTAKSPICIQGGGTRGWKTSGNVMSTSKLSGISLYEPGALTVVASAGTPVSEISAALAAEGQRLAFEPMDHRTLLATEGEPTIGAVVAANISGPRRIQGGAARDYTLGVRFVDGQGNVVKNGGRVMKNVTGYDLVKLMSGAHGTLGVLTEVSLKVLPIPEVQKTLMVRSLDDKDAVRVMSAAMGSPYEVTGAAHCAKIDEGGAVTLLRVEGFETSVDYRLNALKDRLVSFGADTEIVDQTMTDWLWASVRDVSQMETLEGDVWRVLCKPSEAAELADRSGAEGWYFDWAGGLIWIRTKHGQDLRKNLGAFDGHATLIRASDETRARLGVFQPEAAGIARITQGLRHRFDPKGILNRGLMGDALIEV